MPSSSVSILIAEHERLSMLYLNNAEIGEKRTAQYLSIMTFVCGGVFALLQLNFLSRLQLLEMLLVLCLLLVVLGGVTFQRLVERRIRATEYLRGINKIHAFFVKHNSELKVAFAWLPNDDLPPFTGKGAALAGLRDVVAFLNTCFFAGFIFSTLLVINIIPIIAVCASLILSSGLWILHQRYERHLLRTQEMLYRKHVHFPYID